MLGRRLKSRVEGNDGGPNAGNGDLGFAAELFKAAGKLRQNVEPSEYKHIVLGLIFLKHSSMASH